MSDAVAWHDGIADRFDAAYTRARGFRERKMVWSRLISRYAPAGARVLDAGCGSGVLTAVAAEHAAHVLAVDGSAAMLDLARRRIAIEGLAHVVLRLAMIDERVLAQEAPFDLVLCSSVLEYVDDFWGTVDTLVSALAHDGMLLFSVPNSHSVYRHAERLMFRLCGWPRYRRHVRHIIALEALQRELAQRNLEVMETVYYAPAPVLSPVLRALGAARFSDTLVVLACRHRR
ncbi:class I SAM-dependent methyltransferase [Tianweitania sediminis]|uniref:Methyltransferase domain-containing protein n=1 Tax=Tianweitania sediminis TaxID=1502156 RepID=A0A8J7QYZ3_9HYPH|nr:class I SAM-dependent methyltransferase [Tianweitania sediminis]MBP0438575.1 methyltransferase domain-containing protein [Tianweitania sediminis]